MEKIQRHLLFLISIAYGRECLINIKFQMSTIKKKQKKVTLNLKIQWSTYYTRRFQVNGPQ